MAGVPNVFGSATAPIPLSQLDQNFNTTLTIGSTSVGLGNTVTSLAGLANVTMTGNLTYGGVTLSNSVTGTGSMALSASPTFTGTLSSADQIITSTSANALAVGRQGTTNPVLNVDASTASVVTGLNIKGAAAAGGMAVSVTSSGTNENLTIDAKGSGTITINGTATGSVGIGSAPLSTSVSTRRDLTINGSSSGAILSFGNGGVRKGYIANDGTDMTVANETATGYLRFITNSAEAARFDSSGVLHVGSTSSWFGNGGRVNAQGGNNTYPISGYNSGSSGSAFLGRVDNTATSLSLWYYGASTNVGSITTNGTGVTYGSSSDLRLKDNIADAGDAGAVIDALRVRSWDWKSNGAHEFFGFIAQEEVEVYPPAVVVGDDGDEITRQWYRDDSKLVPLLVKEIQSLRRRLEALENNQ